MKGEKRWVRIHFEVRVLMVIIGTEVVPTFLFLGQAGRWVALPGWKSQSEGLMLALPLTYSVTLVKSVFSTVYSWTRLATQNPPVLCSVAPPRGNLHWLPFNVMPLLFMKSPTRNSNVNYSNSYYFNNMNYYTCNISVNLYMRRHWRWNLIPCYEIHKKKTSS